MDAKTLLLTRQSTPRLTEPAPSETQLDFILDAGIRVPDHCGLTPWEFIIAQGDGLNKLGDIFAQAAAANDAEKVFIDKARNMPQRAPMVITVVAKVQKHSKVPVLEQHLAAGCATFAMQQAAFSLGLGAVWRTGDFAFNSVVNQGLGLGESSQIIGFLYIGTPLMTANVKPLKPGRPFARFL
ncbi:NAD(P)H nitroreductase [Shewanella intestini]|uniref:NAD(P)H nitroreductase n=1 Tax=Shewanella TaxID=22 RepID=UPI0013F8961D|nr:NAD(P)H nitroreductase [Shewanella sp. XMDDZSB0408]MRG36903.1 NAD(P)H nitroreductase [Shewanella sp. XMDDZSB0408]